ncbi:MAG TPA: hypothetical protein VL284_12645 [Thermoanaerobaculia bacterium]|nr:hypothetical protein [Thermoanaerobaculia bacterium]
METIIGKSFNKQTVVMDDRNYVNCTFTECEIVYSGGDFSWVTSLFENCKVTVTGHAGKTMAFLHHIGILPKPNGSGPTDSLTGAGDGKVH